MRLDKFIAKSRIIDLKSKDYKEALKELIAVCKPEKLADVTENKLYREFISREKKMTTCLGNGIGMPHVKIPMKRPYVMAIGRCKEGLDFNGAEDYKDLRLIILLLAREDEDSYLNVLAALARIFQEKSVVDQIVAPEDLQDFRDEVATAFGTPAKRTNKKDAKFNQLILKEAAKVAKGAHCSSVMLFGETFKGSADVGNTLKKFKTIMVTASGAETGEKDGAIDEVLPVPSFSNNRLSQLRSSILIGLTRGIIKYNDRLCCVGGKPHSNQLDSIVVVDVESEFQSVFTRQSDMLPSSVKPEVLERVLAIAMELGVEGREGRSIGTLFVIGEQDKIKPYTKPLILNPFFGYKGEDRNILNPFMDETVKELASIDGAFIIRGDGILESAGTLIHAPEYNRQLPGGLGTRHSAGMSITLAADCISIVVSASGQITLFRRGEMLPLMGRRGGLES